MQSFVITPVVLQAAFRSVRTTTLSIGNSSRLFVHLHERISSLHREVALFQFYAEPTYPRVEFSHYALPSCRFPYLQVFVHWSARHLDASLLSTSAVTIYAPPKMRVCGRPEVGRALSSHGATTPVRLVVRCGRLCRNTVQPTTTRPAGTSSAC